MIPARTIEEAAAGWIRPQTATVVIAAFASDRWDYLRDAVASVAAQTRPALETIVVIDHNQDLLARARAELETAVARGDDRPYTHAVVVIPNAGARGASGARNTGVARSRGDVVVFLDDDARATPDWLARLLGHFADPGVVGVGGRVDPLWSTARPRWFPGEFDWTVGASYTGMPERTERVRNVWSNNMAVRRTSFAAAGGFREEFGKVGAVSRPEDTDLCLRVTDGAWLYDPAGAVGHWVPANRASFRYFLVRCFNEGLGKAGLAALNGAGVSTSQERGYAARVLPKAVSRGLREAAHGDGTGALRGGAIIAGLGAAAAGYAVGTTAAAAGHAVEATAAILARDPRIAASQLAEPPDDRTPDDRTPDGRRQYRRGAPMSFCPTAIREVELSDPVTGISATGYAAALVLIRWYSEPLGIVNIPLTDGAAGAEQVGRALWQEVAGAIALRCEAAGQPTPAAQPLPVGAGTAENARQQRERCTRDHPASLARQAGAAGAAGAGLPAAGVPVAGDFPAMLVRKGLQLPWPPAYLLGRAATLRNAPPASVVICTRDRADQLVSCLTGVLGQDYPDFEVIVVDNAPASNAVADLIVRLRETGAIRGIPVRRVVEPRPGLSWARNAGLAAATGKIVAYLDDDERPDRDWLAELARGFTLGKRVVGVSGLVLPDRLDTEAQALYEQFGGHSKGRGLTPEVFDAASHRRQHPLYPLPAFGVGASLAFDRAALTRIGGFDVALGAGTPARAGEDTAAIADVMLDGGTFVYWPGAVMWHAHRATLPEVERQLNGYGSGLTAFYARQLLRHPAHLATLARLAPRALRDLGGRDSVRTATMGADYPGTLRRASATGMLAGPFRYLRSRRVQTRIEVASG